MNYEIGGIQILKVEGIKTNSQNAIIKSHYDFLYKGELTNETDTEKIYHVLKFDLEIEDYKTTLESGENCFIDGVFYSFENGIVVIKKDI